jgi:hypothetical protein
MILASLFGIWLKISFGSEMADCVSDQGRSDLETGGVAALRRGFPDRENAELGRKMPFPV